MIVLEKTDRIKFKVNNLEFIVAPLSYRDRIALSAQVKHISGEAVTNYVEQTFTMLKKCLKGVKGLKKANGKEYKLKFENDSDNSDLTDDCADELLNSFQSGKEVTALVQSSRGDLTEVDGVEFTVLGKS